MSILQLMTIGFMVMVTPTLSTESPEMKILKDTSNFMILEFENACSANITNIKSFNPAPEKPEGYGANVQYYTKGDKIHLINQLNQLLKNTTNNVRERINDLEKKEKENKTHYSNEDILKSFRDIYGILNEGRKNCSLSLSQIEKQDLKTKTLQESQKVLKKELQALDECQTALDKKNASKLSQAKSFFKKTN